MSLVTTIFVTSGRTSKAQNISAFKRMTSIINDFLLPNEKLQANVTIMKFSLFVKENMSPYLDIDAIGKLKFRLLSLKCLKNPSNTKLI